MNQFKKANSFKFEQPTRKDSNDFDDSDIGLDSDFSFDEDNINNNLIEIDNGKSKDDIKKLKQGLSPNKYEEKVEDIDNNSNEINKIKNLSNEEINELYSNKEDSEEEDESSKNDNNEQTQNGLNTDVEKNKENNKNENSIDENNNNEKEPNEENNKSEKDINESKENNKDLDNGNDYEQNNLSKEEHKETEEIEKNEKIEKDLITSIQNKEIVTRDKIKLAEAIQFKNEPDKVIITDEFGFIKKENPKEKNNKKDEKNEKGKNYQRRRSKSVKLLLQVNARIEKWNYMIQNYQEFSTNKKKKALLKSRTRKGIPDSLRGYAWQLFANKDKYYEKDLYQNLEKEPVKEDLEIVIIKDLDRTFPLCQFFREKYGNGQRKLYKVLSAYSKYNKNVGYVQGMGFITAIFLIYMDEESSFYMLHCLMKKYKLEGLYYEGFPDLKKKCYVFLNLQKKYVNSVYKIFQREGIIPTMYLSSWFISLFARTLDFHIVLRVYDCFFLEGFKVIYRIALAILKLNENIFCKTKKGEVLPLIYKCHENLDVEELFKVAFGFNMSRNFIDKCEDEFEKVKNDTNNEFMTQLCW